MALTSLTSLNSLTSPSTKVESRIRERQHSLILDKKAVHFYLFTLLPFYPFTFKRLFVGEFFNLLLRCNTQFLQTLYPSHDITSAIVKLLFSLIKDS